MAEFQWWLLLVGLVAGGGLVAIVSMDGRRREEDLSDLERRAEATWIADRLSGPDGAVDPSWVEDVLRIHREYLTLQPPDRVLVDGVQYMPDGSPVEPEISDGDPDREADDIGDDRGGGTDEHLAAAGEEQAPAGQQAHPGADREQRRD
jgi:hypothetical protein